MHSRMTSVVTLVLLAAPLANPAPPCSGAPLPPPAASSSSLDARSSASVPAAMRGARAIGAARQPGAAGGEAAAAAAAGPAFQAVDSFFDLFVVDPTQYETVATFVQADSGFSNVALTTGLAIHPGTGAVFIAGNDFNSNSYLGQLDFNTGLVTSVGTIAGEILVDIAFDSTGKLYGLTDNSNGNNPHALLSIDTTTAAAAVVKVLDPHGGTGDSFFDGAIAFNPADGSFYYADRQGLNTGNTNLFIDKLMPGTFAQTPVTVEPFSTSPRAMAFTQGKLWLFGGASLYSADAANIAGGLTRAGTPTFPTAFGSFVDDVQGMFPTALPCVPTPTAACLFNRFKIEVTYDARPTNGTGPGNVVLESNKSVKFTFFDPTNIEMILKILDACALNSKWWVFAGGLTNVGVTIKVTDTMTGAVKTYTSKKNHLFQPFADTSAFPCP